MEVYIVERGEDHEGISFDYVFKTRELALAYVNKLFNEMSPRRRSKWFKVPGLEVEVNGEMVEVGDEWKSGCDHMSINKYRILEALPE